MRHEPHRSRFLPLLEFSIWFAGPILRIQPLFDIGMEIQIRPILDTTRPCFTGLQWIGYSEGHCCLFFSLAFLTSSTLPPLFATKISCKTLVYWVDSSHAKTRQAAGETQKPPEGFHLSGSHHSAGRVWACSQAERQRVTGQVRACSLCAYIPAQAAPVANTEALSD